MFTDVLQGSGEGKHGRLVVTADRVHGHERRAALRQRARLVHDQRRHLLENLERRCVAEKNTGLRAAPGANHDRHRRGETERARARDDQHSHGVDEGMRQTRLRPERRPDNERHDGDGHDHRHEPRRNGVGQPLNRRTRSLRLADHANDLGQERVATDPLRFHHDRSGSIDRAAGQRRALGLFDRHRFAAHHRFVDGGRTIDDDAVHRDTLSRTNAQVVAHMHVSERDIDLEAVERDATSGRWREPEQAANRRARPRARLEFQDLTEEHEHRDHGGRFEVHRDGTHRAKRVGKEARGQRRDDAVAVRRTDAKRDEREHVQVPVDDRRPPAFEKWPASPHHDGGGERELDPPQDGRRHQAVTTTARQQLRHHQRENRRRERGGPPEAPRHVVQLWILDVLGDVHRLERHPTLRAGPRSALTDLRVHRARVLGLRVTRHRRSGGVGGIEVAVGVGLESFAADRVAEVVGGAAVVDLAGGVRRIDRHPADRVQNGTRHRFSSIL